jgi:sulfur transfer protein SufE
MKLLTSFRCSMSGWTNMNILSIWVRILEAYPESSKTDDKLIRGCQSRVWLDYNIKDNNNIYFTADSDAIITKGNNFAC